MGPTWPPKFSDVILIPKVKVAQNDPNKRSETYYGPIMAPGPCGTIFEKFCSKILKLRNTYPNGVGPNFFFSLT